MDAITIRTTTTRTIREALPDDYVAPDGWPCGELLTVGDDFSPLRLYTGLGKPIESLAVRIIITGRKVRPDGSYRCKVIFPGDCEPDTETGGRIWFKTY